MQMREQRAAAGLCAREAEPQPDPQGAARKPGRKESAEARCCLVTTKRNGQSNCVVPGLEESHQPRASAVRGHKDSTKNAALPPTRRFGPGLCKSDRGKDRWISNGGLQMRVKNTVKDVGVADSQDKETGCAFQLPKTT